MNDPVVVKTHVHPDTGTRTLTVERWPRETSFDASILDGEVDPRTFAIEGNTVTITVENGWAVYHLDCDAADARGPWVPARLVSCRLSGTDDPKLWK